MFEPITHIKTTKTGKPLSKASVGIYKTRLNRLAEAGYDTIQSLVDKADEVIDLLDMFLDDKDDATEKRSYYNAIFYALFERPLAQKRPYYLKYQNMKDDYNQYKSKL